MKSSLLPPELPKILAGALFGILLAGPCLGQDTLVMKTGQPRQGEVLAVGNKVIQFKSGPATSTVPLDQVAAVEKAEPADFKAAQEALKAGDYAKALPLLKAVTAKYLSLPVPWAETAAAQLGDAYIGLNQIPDAEKAFADFQAAYPLAVSRANLGMAQISLEKKNFDDAKAKLGPILEAANKTAQADGAKGASYGRAYYILGRVLEAEGSPSEALQAYLTTVTLFYQDPTITALAKQKADQLQKSTSVP